MQSYTHSLIENLVDLSKLNLINHGKHKRTKTLAYLKKQQGEKLGKQANKFISDTATTATK